MNIRNIYLIAHITFQEMIRKGIFYLFMFLSAGIIVFSYYMNFFSLGAQTPIIKDFSLSSVSFFSVILTVVLSLMLIPGEIESRTIYPILSKPVRRYEYILGKFFGVISLISLNLVLLGFLLVVILIFKEGNPNWLIFKAIILILAQCMVICALTILLSMVVTPPVNFSIMILIYIIGGLSFSYVEYLMGIMLTGSKGFMITYAYIVAFIFQGIKMALPTFAFFNIKEAVVHGYTVSNFYVLEVVLYGLLYTSFALMLAHLAFEDKDL